MEKKDDGENEAQIDVNDLVCLDESGTTHMSPIQKVIKYIKRDKRFLNLDVENPKDSLQQIIQVIKSGPISLELTQARSTFDRTINKKSGTVKQSSRARANQTKREALKAQARAEDY